MITDCFLFLNKIVWGPATLFLFAFVGIFITFRLDFFQFRNFFYMMRETIGQVFKKNREKSDEISPVEAVSTALAGTIGTGSITGIAMAIRAGGPGVLFWMWFFSFFGMAIKFTEIFLSLKFREKNKDGKMIGGPMFYMEKGLKSKFLAMLFAIFALFCSFGIGNITQSNAISSVFENFYGTSSSISGLVLMVLISFIVFGGIKRICKVNRYLVPFMTLLYIFTAVIVLFLRFENLPRTLELIFRSAFSFNAASFGAVGYGFIKGVHFGISRSIFSNEAGLGSAPIAHAVSEEKDPVKQGLWGIFEVAFTTLVICSLSGFVILTSKDWNTATLTGSEVLISAFDSAIPVFGRCVVGMTTVFFAFSSILGWAYYGEVCILYLFKNKKIFSSVFRVIYIIFVFLGSVFDMESVWIISETLNGLMALPNLIAVLLLSDIAQKECKEFRKKIKKC